MDKQDGYDYQFKLILIGDPSVGKSNLLLRYCKNEFNLESTSTIGVEFGNKMTIVDNKAIKAQVWDTCGQEQFKAIAKTYYKGAVGAFIVYDITRRDTFLNVERWYKDIKDNVGQNIVVMLIGNKCDLKHLREVKAEEASSYAVQRNMAYMETSALDSTNVDLTFQSIIKEVYSLAKENKTNMTSSKRATNERVRISAKPKINEGTSDKNGCC